MPSLEGWLPWALGSALFAALTTLFSKLGVRDVDAEQAALVRTFLVLIALGLSVVARGRWTSPLAIPARAWTALAASALTTGASWVCYLRALERGEASRVAPVDKLSVVLVALLAFALLGERPDARGWLGIALVTAGALLLAR